MSEPRTGNGSLGYAATAKQHPFPLGPGHVFAFKGRHRGMALLGRVHDGSGSLDRLFVRQIQARVTPDAKQTGIYDAALEAHVRMWQKAHRNICNSVRITGAVDAPTWKALGL